MAGVTLEEFGLPSWGELDEARARFVEDVYARVVEWQFARGTARWESPRPLLAERLGYKPVKAMQKEPKDWSRAMRYGLDGDGKVVCAQSFSEGSGPTAQMYTEGLAVDIDGWRVHLTFDVSPHPARLRDVTVEEHADGRLIGTTMILVQSSSSRERYSYDDAGRLLNVVRHNVEYGEIESWTEERVTYAPDGSIKRIAERTLKPGEAPRDFEEVVHADEEEPVTTEQARAAHERLKGTMSDAIVAWHARHDQSGDIRRILLLYALPPNPVLPPGVAPRTDPLTPGGDGLELFYPDGHEIDVALDECEDPQAQTDCALLNAWYDQVEDDDLPVELYIEVAQRAQGAITARTGQSVWVVPVDDDRDTLVRAIRELLPLDLQRELGLETQST